MSAQDVLTTISAQELHAILWKTHRLGNRARLRFIEALLALEETRLHADLGYSSAAHYAESQFRYQRTQIHELLRVARRIKALHRLMAAFEAGELTWSALEEITRVASPESEEEWLEFARKKSFSQLRAEVREAAEKRRDRPRKNPYGLPRQKRKVILHFNPEEHELFQKAMAKGRGEISQSLGGDEVANDKVALYIFRRSLETDPAAPPPGRKEREDPLNTLLYRVCPECDKGHVQTDDGPVEVPPEVIERVEMESRKVVIAPEEEREAGTAPSAPSTAPSDPSTPAIAAAPQTEPEPEPEIDRLNTPRIVLKVLLRDGQVCGNPFCRRKLGLQAHHIQFRSDGGRTELWNETACCPVCHSCIHQGTLEVKGDPLTGLEWRTRADRLDLERKADAKELERVPVVMVKPSGVMASGIPDAEPFVLGLVRLGYTNKEAGQMVARALEALGEGAMRASDEEVLRRAIESKPSSR